MLKEQIQEELNSSLKSGDQLKRLVLGMLATAIKNRELSKRAQLSKTTKDIKELETESRLNDEETLEVIAGEVKKRKEAIEQFRAGGRGELAEKEAKEMEILKNYLPTQLDEAEISSEIEKTISESGAKDVKDMGRVISLVMAKLKGRADGGVVSRIVKERLLKPAEDCPLQSHA